MLKAELIEEAKKKGVYNSKDLGVTPSRATKKDLERALKRKKRTRRVAAGTGLVFLGGAAAAKRSRIIHPQEPLPTPPSVDYGITSSGGLRSPTLLPPLPPTPGKQKRPFDLLRQVQPINLSSD